MLWAWKTPSRLQLFRTPPSSPQPDKPENHPNPTSCLYTPASQSFIARSPNGRPLLVLFLVPMYLCSCTQVYRVLTFCSNPDYLTTTALFLQVAFLVPTPTRLASRINQPLLRSHQINIQPSWVLCIWAPRTSCRNRRFVHDWMYTWWSTHAPSHIYLYIQCRWPLSPPSVFDTRQSGVEMKVLSFMQVV